MNELVLVFMRHAEERSERIRGVKFYKNITEWNPALYKATFRQWEEWTEDLYELIREATKAANWFADVVRRDVNPRFFAIEGRFLLIEGPYMDLSFKTYLIEYAHEERQLLPQQFFEKRKGKQAPNSGDPADG